MEEKKDKCEKIGFTVHALSILEQVMQESSAFGISIGVGIVYETIQQIAIRASQLHDDELDRLIGKLHLYEDMSEGAEEEEKKGDMEMTEKEDKNA